MEKSKKEEKKYENCYWYKLLSGKNSPVTLQSSLVGCHACISLPQPVDETCPYYKDLKAK